MTSELDSQERLIGHLTDRLISPESAEETLDRIEKYLGNQHLPPRTAIPLALATIRKWREASSS